MSRVRHCVECPRCLTRYLISLSPYDNGSYVMTANGCLDEYILYCCCRHRSLASQWKSNEVMVCSVSRTAYERGYGTAREIIPVDRKLRQRWPVDVTTYLNRWGSSDKSSD